MSVRVELVEPAALGGGDGCRILHASKGREFACDARVLDDVPHWDVPAGFAAWPSYVLELRDALVTPRFLPVTSSHKLVAFGASHIKISGDIADAITTLYPEIRAIEGTQATLDLAPPSQEIGGAALLCAGGADSVNHFHFMIDYLPRVLLAMSLGHAEGARILFDGATGTAGREYFAALGLGLADVIAKPLDRTVFCERLIVPSFLARTGCVYPPAVELLRGYFQPVEPPPGERLIYVSRRNWPERQIENEAEIESALAERGFEIVTPERMTMADQLALFSQAAVVAMPHGGALANMVFAPRGCQLVEIMTKFQPAGISIAGLRGQVHWHVKPEPVDSGETRFNQPIAPFLRLIEAALASHERGT